MQYALNDALNNFEMFSVLFEIIKYVYIYLIISKYYVQGIYLYVTFFSCCVAVFNQVYEQLIDILNYYFSDNDISIT